MINDLETHRIPSVVWGWGWANRVTLVIIMVRVTQGSQSEEAREIWRWLVLSGTNSLLSQLLKMMMRCTRARETARWLTESGNWSISCLITHMRLIQTHAQFTCEALKLWPAGESPGAGGEGLLKHKVLSPSQERSGAAWGGTRQPAFLMGSQVTLGLLTHYEGCCLENHQGVLFSALTFIHMACWRAGFSLHYSPDKNSYSSPHKSPPSRNHPCPPPDSAACGAGPFPCFPILHLKVCL